MQSDEGWLSRLITNHKLELVAVVAGTLLYRLVFRSQATSDVPSLSPIRSSSNKRRSILVSENPKAYVIPRHILTAQNALIEELRHLNNPTCRIQKVPNLILERQKHQIPLIMSPLIGDNKWRSVYGGQGFIPEESFVYRGSFVLSNNSFSSNEDLVKQQEWLLAGPRRNLYFHPSEVRAAIVTCGGLCPGLNVVIREIVTNLTILYGCPQVWGVKFGYMGIYSGPEYWERMTLDFIRTLQYEGGTNLGSSRGGFDANKILTALTQKGINQLYVIGGDGTHRGLLALKEAAKDVKVDLALIGIPKTIDNDIPIIDSSFGFQTAVEEGIRAIRSAYVQSRGVNYGIGLVKLMGRDAGFIAMESTNASGDVDICLIPEFPFDIYGQFGVLEFILSRLKVKKHMVVVVAEGAGSGVRDMASLTKGVERDSSGNMKLPDIGVFLKTEIVRYCQQKGINATLKYIDPAYMIRTVPANSYDRKLCAHLASCAVHGAMAGYTGFTVGHINRTPALIPITALKEPNRVSKNSRPWQRLLCATGQPSFLNP